MLLDSQPLQPHRVLPEQPLLGHSELSASSIGATVAGRLLSAIHSVVHMEEGRPKSSENSDRCRLIGYDLLRTAYFRSLSSSRTTSVVTLQSTMSLGLMVPGFC